MKVGNLQSKVVVLDCKHPVNNVVSGTYILGLSSGQAAEIY